MSVLDRSALEASPLADLHLIASELGIDGFRRLRKADLVDAILDRQGGDGTGSAAPDAAVVAADADATPGSHPADAAVEAAEEEADEEDRPRARRRRGTRGRGRRRDEDAAGAEDEAAEPDSAEDGEEAAEREEGGATAEGTVEVLGGGAGFLRVSPPDPSDEDVYISAAQVRRCELVSGDVVTGPVRAPRRSERHPSLIRVDTINDAPADEVAAGTRYDDLPAAFPSERVALGSDDPTVRAIEWLTPFGRGSRVVIAGAARSGKSEALRRLAAALAEQEDLEVLVALAGVRPEELGAWPGPEPAATVTFAASPDGQAQAVERVVEQGRRIASRGRDAVVLIDTLDQLPPAAARRALGAARNIVEGGSLTVVATAREPVGGETTVIALDVALASTLRFPALNLTASGTMRADLLVGGPGAEAIARARATALGLPEKPDDAGA